MRRLALLLVSLCAIPAVLQAQLCAGQAAWSSGAIKVGGELGIGSGTTIVGALGFGKDRGVFAGVGAGVETNGGTASLVQGGIGFELKKPVADKLELCPIANLIWEHDSEAGISVNVIDILGGATVGYPVDIKSENVRLVLTGALQVGNAHLSVSPCSTDCSANDFFGLLDAGVGLIFNNRISVVPQLRFPISSGGDVSFLVRANIAVGKRQ